MADELEIADLTVSNPEPRGAVEHGTGVQPAWMDVTLALLSNSTEPCYVAATVQRLEYVAGRRLLRLWLTEPERPADPEITSTRRIFVPEFRRIDPGATERVTVAVPAVYHQITAITPRGVESHEVDVTGLRSVECTVGYNTEPFRHIPEASANAVRRQLREWARTVTVTVRVRSRRRRRR